jgi:hypothetical protein
LAVSVGVNVTPWLADPATGAVLGAVKAKAPEASTVPPDRVELANVCLYVMAEAVGATLMAGVALATVTLTVVVATLKLLASVGVKVTPWLADPADGAVLGVVKA